MATLEMPRGRDAGGSIFANVQAQFHHAADVMKLDHDVRKMLVTTTNEIEIHFPVKMDDGRIEVFTGYRVQHTMQRAARTRAAFATTLTRTSTTYVRWRRS
jgi:hypothetical protein